MTGKYTSPLKYHSVRLYRAGLRAYLSRLASWTPLVDAKEGYSLCIGCNAPLAAMLGANLQLLSQQDLTHLDKIYVVFDRPAAKIDFPVEQKMRERFPGLPLEFVFYTQREADALARVGWGWAYSWFSWQKAIGLCRTKHALLHDFDAMLIRRQIIEDRYHAVVDAKANWCGIRYYEGNGVTADMELCTTFEMMLDVQFVRNKFKPIDAFNHVTTHRGQTVDFDTFLYCQAMGGTKLVLPIPEPDMVHPSQVICQFTDLANRANYVPPARNNLPFIPYFMYVAGEPDLLRQTLAAMQSAAGKAFPFFGKQLDVKQLNQTHMDWIRKQAAQLEQVVAGGVREEVGQYMDALETMVRRPG